MANTAGDGQVHIVGSCEQRVFGLRPAERLRRQRARLEGPLLVADASAVLGDAAVAWLLDNPGTILTEASGKPMAVAVTHDRREAAERALANGGEGFTLAAPDQLGEQFVRKLRRRDTLLVRSLASEPERAIERLLFTNVYKGVTDLVTKWIWPFPALAVTRLASRLGIRPNMVTTTGIGLTLLAAWLFYRGDLAAGMAAAWTMTFLDTVDGKLARVTVSSSKLGDKLDHVTDYLHPPVWWYCLAAGLERHEPALSHEIWAACWVILGTYVLGRVIEEVFKQRIGFNQYLWRPFDSHFRLVVSRRNVILLIMSIGLLLTVGGVSFIVAAAWSMVSVVIQAARLGQALAAQAGQPQRSWLM